MIWSEFSKIFHHEYVIRPHYFHYEVTQFSILSLIPFLMRFVALQNKNLFFNSFFPPNYESFVKEMSTELPHTHGRDLQKLNRKT